MGMGAFHFFGWRLLVPNLNLRIKIRSTHPKLTGYTKRGEFLTKGVESLARFIANL